MQPNPSTPTSSTSILIAGFMIAIAIYFGLQPSTLNKNAGLGAGGQVAGQNTAGTSPAPVGPVDVAIDGEPTLGSSNAPITLVEFTDFQCPYCKQYFDQTFSQIKQNYIDTGKVKYVVRDFPLPIHPNAPAAALAADCAFDQGGSENYFKYHDLLFGKQSEWSAEKDPAGKFKDYAGQVGLNAGGFNSCYDSGKFKAEVDQDVADGTTAGVAGTPSFFVNGKILEGALPYSEFQRALDAEIK